MIRPDEWNNIALPVTEAIKILVNELAITNSRMNANSKVVEDLAESEQKHYANNLS
jgi:hypothetical protein